MECVLTGNQIKALHRAVSCLSRIGNELLIEGLPDKLIFRTLNASRSAFLAITFKAQFFDSYQLLVPVAQCGVLLKAVCTVFRMTPTSMERVAIILPDMAATKLQWTLECLHGIRKTYWITCTNDPEMQDVALDRKNFSSHLVAKPRDLNRLLANFQSTLQEITLIATEPLPMSPSGTRAPPEGKAIELRSYIDPVKEGNDAALHTQLWIDPREELQEYVHRGPAVDVTFSVKELKAFLAFCEGSEADMHVFFERAGNPILLAPKFGLDDSEHSDFDATLVLATMLGTQLRDNDNMEAVAQGVHNSGSLPQVNVSHATSSKELGAVSTGRQHTPPPILGSSGEPSDHTKVWSDLSGSATKSWNNKEVRNGPAQMQGSCDASEEIPLALHRKLDAPDADRATPLAGRMAEAYNQAQYNPDVPTSMDIDSASRRNPSNWLSLDTEDEDDENDDLYVQSTPPQRRGMI